MQEEIMILRGVISLKKEEESIMIENNRNCEGKITFNTVIRQHWFLKSTICSHTANWLQEIRHGCNDCKWKRRM